MTLKTEENIIMIGGQLTRNALMENANRRIKNICKKMTSRQEWGYITGTYRNIG